MKIEVRGCTLKVDVLRKVSVGVDCSGVEAEWRVVRCDDERVV